MRSNYRDPIGSSHACAADIVQYTVNPRRSNPTAILCCFDVATLMYKNEKKGVYGPKIHGL